MKSTISAIIVLILGLSNCLAQNELNIDTYYFINTQGLDVFVNNQSVGRTPMTLSVTPDRNNTVEFRNRTGSNVMKIQVHTKKVNNVRQYTQAPGWYGNNSPATSYSGYQIASSSADSRSLSISINKAKSEALEKLAQTSRGNRSVSTSRNSQVLSRSFPDAEILECYIYFDDNSYKTFLLVGLPD